jgi:hypothetical protein
LPLAVIPAKARVSILRVVALCAATPVLNLMRRLDAAETTRCKVTKPFDRCRGSPWRSGPIPALAAASIGRI